MGVKSCAVCLQAPGVEDNYPSAHDSILCLYPDAHADMDLL